MKPREIFWLILAAAAFWFLVISEDAHSQSLPPVQTINTNQGIPCNGITPTGTVNFCQPGFTYGCQATQNNNAILMADGNRTAILFQNTGPIPITFAFGNAALAGTEGFVVQPGNSFMWSNIGRGNEPGRVPTTPISINSTPGSLVTCTFMFTD